MPGRIGPGAYTPDPREDVTVTAIVRGDYQGTVTLTPPPEMRIERGTPSQSLFDLKEQLRTLAKRMSSPPAALGRPEDASSRGMMDALAERVQAYTKPQVEVPPRTLTWALAAPREPGRYDIQVEADKGRPVEITAALGKWEPPAPQIVAGWAELPPEDRPEPKEDGDEGESASEADPEQAPLLAVKLDYSTKYKQPPQQTFAYIFDGEAWGKGWWLSVYLVVYLAAMFLLKTVLRIA